MSITLGDLEKTIRVKNIQSVLEYYDVQEAHKIQEILEEMIHAEDTDWR